ncbi:Ig-like domain-containing protein [Synechococcus sp. FACHB-909]|uniref:tandem-95 repeat protein n=2 Tax=Synechococcus TaxID=1129 RepID=UPI001681E7BE|nr:Ig-like domain-containing protein [Synechococcus sp. FACHB-909]MBD2717893.1 tandem-95 repeat protein [Synechococcus sp. FACHB-909]
MELRWATALLNVNRILEDLPLRDDYEDLLSDTFATAGTDSDQFQSRVISLAQVLRGPGLQLAIERRSGEELSGASGAYTPGDPDGRQRIYINANWLSLATSVEAIQRVLLEEVGHAIDQWLNGPLDARGDEGALFAALVTGAPLVEAQRAAILADNDQHQLLIDGRWLAAEFAAAPVLNDSFVGTRITAEDTPLAITGLSVADSDNGGGPITLRLRITTTGGTATLASAALITSGSNGSADLTLEGSLAAINAAIASLLFTPAANANSVNTPLAPSLTLTATDLTNGDGPISLTTGPIQVTPVNDAPTLVTSPLVVAEGGTSNFTLANFTLSDVDNLPEQVIYRITSLPGKGTIRLNGNPLVVGSSFSSSFRGSFTYTHDGSQVLPGVIAGSDSDAVTVSVDDGAGGRIASATVPISLTPVNQAPAVSGSVAVFEGQRGVPVTLSISDADQAAGVAHTVVITSLPSRGTLRYNGTPITAPFTLPSLAGLTYDHDGNDLNGGFPPNESFGVRVSDDGGGQGTGGVLSSNAVITLAVQRVNDDPTLTANNPIVTPTGSTAITAAALRVSDADSPSSNLTYTLTAAADPARGQLQVFRGGTWVGLLSSGSFSQDDIDTGRLRFNFVNGTPSGTTADFTFTVEDGAIGLLPGGFTQTRDGGIHTNSTPQPLPGDPLTPISFRLTYLNSLGTPSSGGGNAPTSLPANAAPSLATNNLLRTSEAATVTIRATDLAISDSDSNPAERVYRLTAAPAGGSLQRNGVVLNNLDVFTQDDINNGRLTFVHGGGEVFDSGFRFNISDGRSVVSNGASDFRFAIRVTPINDAPSASVSGSTSLLVEGGTLTFNSSSPGPLLGAAERRDITIADVDGSGQQVFAGAPGNPNPGADALWDPGSFSQADTADQRRLRIDTLPANGVLEFDATGSGAWTVIGDGSGGSLNRATLRISQSQLSAGRLRYRHNGNDGPGELADSFVFTPLDRFDAPGTPVTVPLTIAPLNDPPAAIENTPLTVAEGSRGVITGSASSSTALRLAYGDSDNSPIQRQYRITSPTSNGRLFLNGRALGVNSVFTQADLDNNLITYLHDGTETSSDAFSFRVSDGGGDNPISGATNEIPGTFVIAVTPANDLPSLSSPASLDVFGSGATPVAVASGGLLRATDSDLDTIGSGETDLLRIEAQLLDGANAVVPSGLISFTSANPSSARAFLSGKGSNSLVVQGTRSEINAVLASLTVAFGADLDASNLKLRVSVDDRLYSAAGVLGVGANGGPVNQNDGAGNPVPIDAANNRISRDIALTASNLNDLPTITNPTLFSVNEDASVSLGGFVLADADSFGRNVSVQVQLFRDAARTVLADAATEGRLLLGAIAGLSAATGDGTNTITLTGPLTAVQTALNLLRFQGAPDFNGAGSGLGSLFLRTSLTDFGHANVPAGHRVSVDNGVRITPVNDAPVLAVPANTVIAGGTFLNISSGFAIQDTRDTSQGASDDIRVTLSATDAGSPYGTLLIQNANGATLTTNGTASVQVRGTRTQVQAALNTLRYTPANPNVDRVVTITATAFDFDNGAEAVGVIGNNSATGAFTINVSSTNEAPVLTAPVTRTVVEDSGANAFTGANLISFSDPDDFGALQRLTVAVNRGTINLVTRTGLTVTGGNYGTTSLTVTGTEANLNAALASLTYTPTANFHGSATLTVVVNDLGSTGSGGARQAVRSVALTVTPLNDQPVATTNVVLPAIAEDVAAAAIAGATLSSLAFGYSDATDNQTANGGGSTATPFSFLAVVGSTSYTAAQGVWQISTSATPNPAVPADWINLPSAGLSTAAALVFSAASRVRFVPAANFHGTPGRLLVRLADASAPLATSTTPTTTFNLATAGGTTATGAWSAVNRTIATTVTNVNDRPTASAASLAATTEDNPNPPGATIAALGFGFRDTADDQRSVTGGANAASALGGIAITGNAATAAQGVWQYNLNAGAGWVTIASPSESAALLLPTSASLRFLPSSPNFNGTPGGLRLRVADTPLAFSAATNLTPLLGPTGRYSDPTSLNTSVTPVNDVPAFTRGPDQTLLEDAGAQSVTGWATGLSRGGGADEAGQALSFLVTNNNNALFSAQPTIDASGRLTYTPAANATGTATVSVRVRDSGGTANGGIDTSAIQTFLISVTPANDDFTDANETRSIAEGSGTTTGSLLSGTSSPDGPVSIASFSIAGQSGPFPLGSPVTIAGVGSLTIAANGSYAFTPAANYNGPVPLISYAVTDGSGANDTSTLTITVTPVNNDFSDANETLSIAEDSGTTTGNLLSGTTSPDGPVAIASFSIAGQSGPFPLGSPVTIAGVGSLTIAANGSYSFTPAANYNGTVPLISYVVTDGSGPNDSSTLAITVTPVNDDFSDVSETLSIAEDSGTTTGNLLAGTTSPDGPVSIASFSIAGQSGPFPLGSPVTIAGVGSLTIAANGSYSFTPAANYNGPVPLISYVVTDGSGLNDSSTLSITVTPVNDDFSDANETLSIAEDSGTTTGNLLAGTSSPDGPVSIASFSIAGQSGPFPLGSPFTIAGVGSLTIAANGSYSFTPASNYNGPVPLISYVVTDGSGLNDSSTLSITVTPTNDPPVNTVPAGQSIDEETSLFFSGANVISVNDVDGNLASTRLTVANGILTIGALNGATISNGGNGTSSLTLSGSQAQINAALATLSYLPNPNFNGADTLTVLSTDSGATPLSDADTVAITVTPVNDDFSDVNETLSIAEDSGTTTGNLLAGTTSPDGPVSIASFSVAGLSGPFTLGSPITIAGVGSLTIAANGSYSFTPAANYNGPVPLVTYAVTDGSGANDASTLSITVTPVNDDFSDANETLSIAEDSGTTTGNLLAGTTSPDGPVAIASFSIAGQSGPFPLGSPITIAGAGSLTIAADGSYSFTPAANYNGPVPLISYAVTDGSGANDASTLSITVTPVNDPPVATDDVFGGPIRPAAGTTASVNVTDNDSDLDSPLDPASITIVGSAGPGQSLLVAGEGTWSVNSATQEISFTPVSGFVGDPTPIQYTIRDLQGAISNPATVTIDYDNLAISPNPPVPAPRHVDFYLLLDSSTSMKGSDPSGVSRIEAQNRLAFETLKSALAAAGYGYTLKGSNTFQPFLDDTNLTSSQTLATDILNYELVDDPTDGSSTNARSITIHTIDFGYLVSHSEVTFTGSNPNFGELLARDVLLTQTPDITYGATTSPDWIARGLPAPNSLDAYTAPGTNGNRYSGTEMLGALVALDRLLVKELPNVALDTIVSVAMITDGRPERRPWWDNRPDFGQGWTGTNVPLPTSSWLDGDPILSSGLRYTSSGTPIRVPTAAGVDIWGQAQTSLNNTLDTVAARAGASNVNVLAIGMGDGGISNWNAIYTDLFTNQTFDASRSWNYQFSTSGQLPQLSG